MPPRLFLPATVQRITSPHNPRLREAARLVASARDRRKAGKCVIEGEHLIMVYAERMGAPEVLIMSEQALQRPAVAALGARFAKLTLVVPTPVFAELATLPPGIGVIAVVPTPQGQPSGPCDFCVLLEDLQDPGNVGSILRTAAAAGVDRVLLSKHCAFAWSPKVLRAGQGAHFLLAIEEGVDLPAWAAAFADGGGRVVAAVVEGGGALFDAPLAGRVAIAIGNEGSGLSRALEAAVSARISIPMPGGMESLNAAAAAAICMFECVRQRLAADGA
ncbi:MAG: RNA methyltransferase [Betaproteobacteria bacterium]